MQKNQLSLRKYLEEINKECSPLDHDALIKLILGLSKEVPMGSRGNFLDTLQDLIAEGKQLGRDNPDVAAEKIIADIEALLEEIMDRVEAIEDGSYWDDPDDPYEMDEEDWRDGYYLDEDPDNVNDTQMSALVDFCGEADHLFLHGDKATAEKIYHAILSLIDEVEKFGALPDSRIDLYEIRARFARCVYEVSSEKERVKNMLAAMNATQPKEEFERYFTREYPWLKDVVDTDTGNLEGFYTFLTSWKTALSKCSFTPERTAELLLEATYMDDGIGEVGKLACKWQEKQPLGYLYWLEKLENEENWQFLRDGAIEALVKLPLDEDRCKVSDYLIMAGEKLGEDKNILTGYRERFRSKPGDNSLLDLVAEAKRHHLRKEELDKIIEFCSKQKQGYDGNILFVKALLMAGRLDQACIECRESKAVGWSNNANGLLFASTLYLLSEGNSGCSLIHRQLSDYTESKIYFDSFEPQPRPPRNSYFDEIVYGLNLVNDSSINLDDLRKWAGTIGESRINHIVSNKHRRAYGKAATVLGSLAELLTASGNKQNAQNLLNEYCKVLFNRHVAFRREVKAAIGSSKILREIGIGV